MFVHYSGTKAAFIAAGLPSQYTNKIVFIKGGENGTGACVYTHGNYYANVEEALAALKYFSKISAGGVTAEAASPNGTINFSADDPAAVSVKVDSTGVHFGLTDEFKTAVNTTLPNRIKAVEDDYLKGADKTELEGKVAAALAEAKGYTDTKVGEVVDAANEALIGAQGDASTADTIYGAKKHAEEKAAAAQAAAEGTAAADATAKVNAAKEELNGTISGVEGRVKAIEDDYLTSADKQEITGAASALEVRVKANEDAIGVLNGEGEGSVKKQVSDAIAGVVASAPEDFDTLKEVADWIASDTTGAAKMQADIARLDGADTVDGSVKKQIKDAVAAEAQIARAAEKQNADDIDAAEGRIKAIEDDYLKAADKTALQGSIDAVSAVANAAAPQATTYTKTEVDGLIGSAEGKLADYYKKSETYSKAEVEAMWAWEEL
jgi:hypothetical protein